jgi:hypothetical protein
VYLFAGFHRVVQVLVLDEGEVPLDLHPHRVAKRTENVFQVCRAE